MDNNQDYNSGWVNTQTGEIGMRIFIDIEQYIEYVGR